MLKRQRNYIEPTYTTNDMSNYTERNDSELRSVVDEIDEIVTKLENYKERIHSD
jgi:predicted DNA-binding protein YlxM (UPF0122 family)